MNKLIFWGKRFGQSCGTSIIIMCSMKEAIGAALFCTEVSSGTSDVHILTGTYHYLAAKIPSQHEKYF